MADVIESARLADLLNRLAHADLAGEVAGELEPEVLLDRVLRRAVELVPGAHESGVTLRHCDRPEPAHFGTGALVDAAAMLEDQLGEGPAHEAADSAGTVRVEDLAADTRWPGYAGQASGFGLCSILVTALPSEHRPCGTFAVCSSEPGSFAEAAEQIMPNVANWVAVAVAHAAMMRHMRRAIDSRSTIGQACGILIERHKLRPEQAFEMLVSASQRNHLKLRDLAARVVETGQEPDVIKY